MSRFFTIWGGQAISLLGSQLVQFALIWYLTTETHSATVLALATMMEMLPRVLLGPLAGALIDRWNRRVVMIAADSLIALAVIALAADFALGLIRPWHVLALLFARAVGAAFHWPAMQASTSLMVPEEHLPRIAGLNQALWGGMNILSAPLGAFLLSVMSIQSILLIDVGTALLGITPLLFIAVPQPPRKEAAPGEAKPSFGQDFRAGLRYVWGWKGLFLLTVLATLLNFVAVPPLSLLPLLVTDIFRKGAGELAALEAALSGGMIAGGILLGVWGGFKKRIYTSLLGLIGMGAGILLVGLAPASVFLLAVGGMLMAGVMMALTNGPLFAILQATVDADMQGRVFTLVGSLSGAAAPLGLMVAGPLADAVGVQIGYVAAGLACLIMAAASLTIPAIRDIEQHGQAQASEVESTTPLSIEQPAEAK